MPGIGFSPEEELEIAKLMDLGGIFMTNGGIPVASTTEMEVVKLPVKGGFSKIRVPADAYVADAERFLSQGALADAFACACCAHG